MLTRQRLIFALCMLMCATADRASSRERTIARHELVGRQALEAIELDIRSILPDWSIRFFPGRPGYLGMTYMSAKRIDIWVRETHGPKSVKATIAHEVAHGFDIEHMTDELRREWLRARGLPLDTTWFNPCSGCRDNNSGAGDFAESVQWTVNGPSGRFKSALGKPPTIEQQNLIRQWLSALPRAEER